MDRLFLWDDGPGGNDGVAQTPRLAENRGRWVRIHFTRFVHEYPGRGSVS